MKEIDVTLNRSSLRSAVKEIEKYKKDLNKKTKVFVQELLKNGISVAKDNTGSFGGKIHFKKWIEADDGTVYGLLIGSSPDIIVKWYTSANKKTRKEREEAVNPLLLAEFGSGYKADPHGNVGGVGQGTMPNSYGHAFDAEWFWYDKNGTKHSSSGEEPTYPLYKAWLAMKLLIEEIASEVFSS